MVVDVVRKVTALHAWSRPKVARHERVELSAQGWFPGGKVAVGWKFTTFLGKVLADVGSLLKAASQ